VTILHLINNLGPGGAEKLLTDVFLLDQQHDNILYLLSSKGNFFLQRLENLNKRIIISKRKSIYSIMHFIDLYKTMKLLNPAIVHVHLFPSLYYASVMSRFFPNTVFVFTEHSTTNRRRTKPYFRPIERWIYNGYERVIAISEPVATSLSHWLQSSTTISIIQNGLHLDDYIHATPIDMKNYLHLASGSKLLLMVARFTPYKNHEILLEALSLLESDVHLLLVGEGETKSLLLSKCEELQILERVHFLGLRTDVPQLLKSVDVAVLSSHYEGFGLFALEAIATGCALVITNTPGLINIVGLYANVVASNTSIEMSVVIRQLLQSELKKSSTSIQTLFPFSMKSYLNKINTLYRSVKKEH
jgi:glycosyltransferase involved in cell wall biosynthesis